MALLVLLVLSKFSLAFRQKLVLRSRLIKGVREIPPAGNGGSPSDLHVTDLNLILKVMK